MADILIATVDTDEDGLAAFRGLPPGTYKYVQTAAKEGYALDPQEYTVTITDNTPVVEDRTNAPIESGSITITKHVAGYPDFVLSGATFTVQDSTGKPLVSESTPTPVDGTLVFANLMTITQDPQTYTVLEVTPPTGYAPNAQEYDVEVLPSANSAQAVPNTPTVEGGLDVELIDQNYTEYGLDGAKYSLYAVIP